MKDHLDLLKNIAAVEGILLCRINGAVVEHSFPSHYDADQIRKMGLTFQHAIAALERENDRLRHLELVYRESQVLMWAREDFLLAILTGKEVNRAVLDRSVTTFFDHLSQTPPQDAGSGIAPHTEKIRPANPHEEKRKPRVGPGKLIWALSLLVILAIAGLFFFFFHLAAPPPPKQLEKEPVPVAPVTLFRMHGSNTIGARLAPALAAAFLKAAGAEAEPVIQKTGDVDTVITASIKGKPPLQIEVSAHGSSTAFSSLLEGKADIGMASRPIKTDEVDKLALWGNLAGPEAEHVLAMDGLAIVVHPGNGLRQLDIALLAGLFSGKISDWSQIPQSKLQGPVHIYARDDKSGTYDTFKSLVLNPKGVKLVETAKRYEDSKQLSIDVSNDTLGIGFIGLPYIQPAKAVAVSDTGVHAIYPNNFTVATEDYPLSRRLFLYLPPKTANSHARDFAAFALSEKGQKIVRETGFIDLLITEEKISDSARHTAPKTYQNLARSANRLSLNFRFQTNSDQLDSKALQDIHRLVEFLRQDRNQGRRIRLIGFTDNIGNKEQNCRLSLKRAKTMGEILNGYGLFPRSVEGLCDDMPVASNQSLDGREKNRRVEVWIEQQPGG